MPEYDTEKFIIQLANGEFCANKHYNEMLDILLSTKWQIILLSNFSLYREKLATLMETGRIKRLIVSIDAGTRETFKAVKGNDRFDIVCENLKKYPVHRTNLQLKYVFIEGMNDNETDVDGFYEIAKAAGGTIILSADLSKRWTENMRALAVRIIKKAKADNVSIGSGSSYLHREDVKFINKTYEEA
jgi:molybdenum cofactor biosynthesis enzyme MoaA